MIRTSDATTIIKEMILRKDNDSRTKVLTNHYNPTVAIEDLSRYPDRTLQIASM